MRTGTDFEFITPRLCLAICYHKISHIVALGSLSAFAHNKRALLLSDSTSPNLGCIRQTSHLGPHIFVPLHFHLELVLNVPFAFLSTEAPRTSAI